MKMKNGIKRVVAVTAMLAVLMTAFSFGASAAVDEDAAESGAEQEPFYAQAASADDAAGEAALADTGAGEPVAATEALEPQAPVFPIITKLENVNNGVKITWDSFEGAVSYRIYYFKDNTWARLGTVQGNSYTDTTAANGETRVYTVRGIGADGRFCSDFDREGRSHTYFAAPVIDALSNTETGVRVKWTRTDGAGLYRVYRKVGSGSWQMLAQTDASEYTDTTAVSGTTYRYTLRIVTPDGSSFMSSHNNGKTVAYVAAPQITALENKGNGAKLTWAASEGAAAYCVYYRTDTWKKIAQVKGTSYTDTGVKDSETRTYTVRCLGADGKFCSDFDREGVSGTYYAPPVIASLTNTLEGVQAKWSPVEDAGHYRLYRKVSGGSWQLLTQTDAGEYTDTTAVSGTTYTYTLRMVSDDGKRFISDHNSGKTITCVAAPAITKLENTAAGVRVTWNKPDGAQNFRIYVKNGGGWKLLKETTATSYVHEGLTDKTEYTYTVRCVDSKGKSFVSGFDSVGWSRLYYAAPAVPTVTAVGDRTQLTWEAVDEIAGYRLYRKTFGGSWARLFEATKETSYLDTTAQKDTLYTYTVRLLDDENNTVSGYIDNNIYYYNGTLANGTIASGDNKYYFDNGKLRSGFQIIDKKRCYYDANGALVKNDIVGSDKLGWYFADDKGICCESEEIRLAATFMAKYCKGKTLKDKAKYAFMYLADNYPYRRSYDHPQKVADIPALAVDFFSKRSGNCYRYAAAYACIAKIAGYRARVAVGNTGGMPHGWTEVYNNGRWYYCDVDANLPNYGVPDYYAYMMTTHCWSITTYFRGELFIENGKAVWK